MGSGWCCSGREVEAHGRLGVEPLLSRARRRRDRGEAAGWMDWIEGENEEGGGGMESDGWASSLDFRVRQIIEVGD